MEDLAKSQRIYNRFEQFAQLGKSIKFPTESEVEAIYEERKKAVLTLAKRGWFIPTGMTVGEFKTLFKKNGGMPGGRG